MNLAIAHDADPAAVLGEALVNAGKWLGLNQAALGDIVGKDRTAISRGRIDPRAPGRIPRCEVSDRSGSVPLRSRQPAWARSADGVRRVTH